MQPQLHLQLFLRGRQSLRRLPSITTLLRVHLLMICSLQKPTLGILQINRSLDAQLEIHFQLQPPLTGSQV